MSADLDRPTMSESTADAAVIAETVADVSRWLRDVEPERQRLQVSPVVDDAVAADLLAALTDLAHTVGVFRRVAEDVGLTAATDGPIVTSDGSRGWRRDNYRSGGFGGNAHLVPLTPTELGELT
jgi:hypothetical protein